MGKGDGNFSGRTWKGNWICRWMRKWRRTFFDEGEMPALLIKF